MSERGTAAVRLVDGVAGGLVAAVASGIPSTLHAMRRRESLLASTRAAGSLVVDDDRSGLRQLASGLAVHLALSAGWGGVIGLTLPSRRARLAGLAWGAVIAAADLGVVGRRYPRIAALAPGPQVADHLAFGLVVAAVVTRRRRARDATVTR